MPPKHFPLPPCRQFKINQLLFQDPNDESQNISEEEKRYNDFKNKVTKEVQDHFNHLKIEIDLNDQEEVKKENI